MVNQSSSRKLCAQATTVHPTRKEECKIEQLTTGERVSLNICRVGK